MVLEAFREDCGPMSSVGFASESHLQLSSNEVALCPPSPHAGPPRVFQDNIYLR